MPKYSFNGSNSTIKESACEVLDPIPRGRTLERRSFVTTGIQRHATIQVQCLTLHEKISLQSSTDIFIAAMTLVRESTSSIQRFADRSAVRMAEVHDDWALPQDQTISDG